MPIVGGVPVEPTSGSSAGAGVGQRPRTGTGGGGGLRICGCSWRVASDDLVFPAWIEFGFRLLGLLVLVGVLAFEEATSSTCAAEFHLNVYLLVAISLFSLTLFNLALLGSHSARGTIWGSQEQTRNPRRYVPALVYMNIVLTVGEVIWALVGNIWVVKGLLSECVHDTIKITDIPLYLIFAVIVTTWIGLGLKIIVSCLSFNTIEACSEPKGHNETFVMERPKGLATKILQLCCKKTTSNVFQDVANVLADVFDDPNFVPTDIAAALILLYARQHPDQQMQQLHDNDQQQQSVVMSVDGVSSFSLAQEQDNRQLCSSVEGNIELVRVLMEYAGAAYGYTWFLMRQTSMRLCKMAPYLKCCACCSCCHEQGFIEADNCLQCNTAALKTMLPHLKEDCIVHISFRNKLMEVPYFVAVDERYKKVIVSIRGTLSLEDALTDLCATPAAMSEFNAEFDGFLAHSGMVKAAHYVYRELKAKHILEQAFSQFPVDYELVVTGHSLGAGTAVILAFMLRSEYPNVRCFAYSPPGGLLNERAARASEDFTLSIIVGQDLVPRLSFQSVLGLKAAMKAVLHACRLPKYKILGSGLCSCFVKDWRRHLLQGFETLYAPIEVSSSNPVSPGSEESRIGFGYEALAPVRQDSDLSSNNLSLTGVRCVHEKMYLPGQIWHLENKAMLIAGSNMALEVTVKRARDFQDILVSPKMLTDHFPNNVCDMLGLLKPVSSPADGAH